MRDLGAGISIETALLEVVALEGVAIRLRIARKIISEIKKTMSYVEKIMSDVIQTTSDLFLPFANI